MAFMRDANNLNWAFVCADALAASTGTVDAAGDILDGQVVALDEANAIITTALSDGDQFKLAQRNGGELIISPLFTFQSATGTNFSDEVQQVTTIGSNGTTTVGLGDFDVDDDTAAAAAVGNSYYVLIEKQDNDEANRSGYQPSITAQAKLTNPGGYTNAEEITVRLAEQLREAIRVNDQLEASTPSTKGPKYLRAEVIAAGLATPANITAGANNATFVHGSKTVTLDAAAVAGIAAADYLNVAGDLYKIDGDPGTGTTITLEQPYGGPSASFTTGTAADECGFNTAANVIAATGVGIRLTGVEQHDFDVARERLYGASVFNVRFAKDGENVGAAITTGTQASNGTGEWRSVATDFYNSMGNLGQRWVSDTPGVERTSLSNVVSSAAGFGTIGIQVEANKRTMFGGTTTAKQTVRLYVENTDDGGVSGAGIAQLQTVFGTSITTT
jgi:hypothetical protein